MDDHQHLDDHGEDEDGEEEQKEGTDEESVHTAVHGGGELFRGSSCFLLATSPSDADVLKLVFSASSSW